MYERQAYDARRGASCSGAASRVGNVGGGKG